MRLGECQRTGIACYTFSMATEGGGGEGDLATIVIGIIILGALASVAYDKIKRFGAVPAPTQQEASATSTGQ